MSELAEDTATRVARNEARSVPAEGQTGYYLGVTGQSPFRYAFLQPPDDEIPRFPGSPDGVRGAPIDSLVRNTDDHTVWINTDGDTAWQLVGTGVPGSLPIINDSGTHTQSIFASSDRLILNNVLDTGAVLLSRLILDNDGTAYLEAQGGEAVVYSVGPQARLECGDAVVRAQSVGGVEGAQLVAGNVVAEMDDGTYTQVTFHVGTSFSGWVSLFETMTAVAPDGDLTPGDMTVRLDPTNGAAKFEVKAKTLDGTVVTGSFALA